MWWCSNKMWPRPIREGSEHFFWRKKGDEVKKQVQDGHTGMPEFLTHRKTFALPNYASKCTPTYTNLKENLVRYYLCPRVFVCGTVHFGNYKRFNAAQMFGKLVVSRLQSLAMPAPWCIDLDKKLPSGN